MNPPDELTAECGRTWSPGNAPATAYSTPLAEYLDCAEDKSGETPVKMRAKATPRNDGDKCIS